MLMLAAGSYNFFCMDANKKFRYLALVFLFLVSCMQKKEQRKIKVGIVPLKSFSPAASDTVKKAIESFYGFETLLLPKRQIPPNAHVNIKSPRYRADSILLFLNGIRPRTFDHLLGLTDSDISVTMKDENGKVKEPYELYADWGVLGYGNKPGAASVVSSFRLDTAHPRFYERLKKVALHELGHNMGLDHCPSDYCLMRDANEKLSGIDQEGLLLCESCKQKLGIKQ